MPLGNINLTGPQHLAIEKKIDYKEVAEECGTTRKGIKKGVPRPVETDEPNTKGLEGANQLTTKEGEINSMFFIDFKDYYIYIMWFVE